MPSNEFIDIGMACLYGVTTILSVAASAIGNHTDLEGKDCSAIDGSDEMAFRIRCRKDEDENRSLSCVV